MLLSTQVPSWSNEGKNAHRLCGFSDFSVLLFDELFNDAIHSEYAKLFLPRGLPVEYDDTSSVAAITTMKKFSFSQLSSNLQSTVPYAVDVGIAFNYSDFPRVTNVTIHQLFCRVTIALQLCRHITD